MNSVDCELINRPVSAPQGQSNARATFWPSGRRRLILLFEAREAVIIALGIDPEQPRLAFRALLHAEAQKVWFIEAVKNGREPTDGTPQGDAVVITDSDGGGHGPKCLTPPP